MKFTKIKYFALLSVFALGLGIAPNPATADDPAFISFGVGHYDWNRKNDEGVEFRAEYRHDEKYLGFIKPFVAASLTSNGSGFIGAGILADIYLGRRIVATPSFAPHYYNKGGSDFDLGHAIEFRSQFELAYRMDDRSRIGIAISHYSNNGYGDRNPGSETTTLYYSIPIDSVFGN